MKPYDQLTITDDFIFCKVISNHDLCRQMVETLLDIEIDRIEFITNQSPIQPALNKRGIRMDIYVKDSNRIFDIEIQTTNKYDLEKRTRYYQALMDIDQLEHSANVKELKECLTAALAPYPVMPVGNVVCTKKKKKDDSSSESEDAPKKKYEKNGQGKLFNAQLNELKEDDKQFNETIRAV